MPTSAIKDLLKKWADIRAMVLEWHPNQADVSRGDLAKKKIYPTLWALYRDGLLPPKTKFVGYARSNLKVEDIKTRTLPYMQVKNDQSKLIDDFFKVNIYVSGTYEKADDFDKLNEHLDKLEKASPSNRLFYLALPPTVFSVVTENLKLKCMSTK
ncbi:glucose-6-phosphate 1-dehydrogenase [Trichonephila clavipes]|nr:glucose-6-phosphate 1-dehydrogenase [Trichonephila clavipes]